MRRADSSRSSVWRGVSCCGTGGSTRRAQAFPCRERRTRRRKRETGTPDATSEERNGNAGRSVGREKKAMLPHGASLYLCRLCKPGSVLRCALPVRSPCHLSTTAVTRRLKQPTPRHRTSNPSLPVYTVLQPVRRTAADITASAVGSYPAFSPLPVQARAVILCYVSYNLTAIKSLAWTVLCVARTFLSLA